MNISIIIPVKNQHDIVKNCLKSIIRYQKSEVVLIDDGSTEQNTIELLKNYSNKFGWKLFRNEKSVGHTGACQKGIDASTFENIFLLNSDIIVTPNSLELLAKVLDENEKIAVVGPCSSSASGPQLIPILYQKRFTMTLHEIHKMALICKNNNVIQDIELVNGFCFGIKRSVYNKVGGFDEVLTCYGNEKELLVRIRKAGYRTVLVSGAYIHHYGKMTYSHEPIDIARACVDADRYINKKHK